MVSGVFGGALYQLFEISNELFLLERIGPLDVEGLDLSGDTEGGLVKLKLCHTRRVEKGCWIFPLLQIRNRERNSWIVLGCRQCYFMLPWRRNVRGMLFTCSFSLKLIEPTPDIAHYRKRV